MATDEPPLRIDWSATPIVFVEAATCAHCGSTEYETRRSESNGDGSRTKLAVCRLCHKPFKISVEFPEFGNIVWPDDKIRTKEQ